MKALSLILAAGLALPGAALASRWNGYDSPEKMGKGRYSYRYSDGVPAARLSNPNVPWAETYWPSNRGGIAYRWKTRTRDTWHYHLYSLNELKQMSRDQIAALSPAEKYDIWQGRYDYPTVRKERGRTSPNDVHWAGLCHGWAPAAMLHHEPVPRTVTNPDGIEVPFGSSDIKGLLSFYYGKVNWEPRSWTGSKCGEAGVFKDFDIHSGCDGVNAGTVHLILTNQLGRLDQSFIMDRDRYREIWNQPFLSYAYSETGSCRPNNSRATRGTAIRMKATYVDELKYSQWDPEQHVDSAGRVRTRERTVTYRYCLELDRDDRIVGGEWLSAGRPGFIWTHARTDFAHDYWGRMRELLND